jgi:hypothetical protein
MIRIVLGATAREAGNLSSRAVGGEGQQGCVAGLSITDVGRLRINETARLRALLFDSKRMGKSGALDGNFPLKVRQVWCPRIARDCACLLGDVSSVPKCSAGWRTTSDSERGEKVGNEKNDLSWNLSGGVRTQGQTALHKEISLH